MKASALIALVFLFLLAPESHAKKPAIIGWGEKIAEVAEVPKELGATSDVKLGYYYNSFRVMFVPLVTWGSKYVLFSDKENSYGDLKPEELANIEKSVGSLGSKGGLHTMWARWVNWLWPVLVGLYLAKKIIGKRSATYQS